MHKLAKCGVRTNSAPHYPSKLLPVHMLQKAQFIYVAQKKSLIECHSFCSSPCKPPYYKKSDPASLLVFYAHATGGDSRSSTYILLMREVQNIPVFFTSRWLFGLGGRFPVREVQNFAGICTSRVRHEMYSVFSLIRDTNKYPDPFMSRPLFRLMPVFIRATCMDPEIGLCRGRSLSGHPTNHT